MFIPIITIIGNSGSGKTTLLERLIPEFKLMGYRVGTVKHHSHAGFEIDQPGKDSWRHARAGSDHVVIAAPDKIASYRRVEKEPSLDEIAAQFTDVDLILVEGYRVAGKPSIQIVRGDLGIQRLSHPDQLIAVAANVNIEAPVPVFDLEDAHGIASFIKAQFLARPDSLSASS